DDLVTRVQTCALPILTGRKARGGGALLVGRISNPSLPKGRIGNPSHKKRKRRRLFGWRTRMTVTTSLRAALVGACLLSLNGPLQIGRASCRDRVWIGE